MKIKNNERNKIIKGLTGDVVVPSQEAVFDFPKCFHFDFDFVYGYFELFLVK